MRLMLIAISFGTVLSPAAYAQTITPKHAAEQIGLLEAIYGTIASEHTAYSSRSAPTFINLDLPYPHPWTSPSSYGVMTDIPLTNYPNPVRCA